MLKYRLVISHSHIFLNQPTIYFMKKLTTLLSVLAALFFVNLRAFAHEPAANLHLHAEQKNEIIELTWDVPGEHDFYVYSNWENDAITNGPLCYVANCAYSKPFGLGIKKISSTTYLYTDISPQIQSGIRHYKLVVDKKTTFETSIVIKKTKPVILPTQDQTSFIAPPPSQIQPEPNHIVARVYDLSGKLILSFELPYTSKPEVINKTVQEELKRSQTPKGIYTYKAYLPDSYQRDWWTEHDNITAMTISIE
jgi:hypothetical protein